MTPKQAAKRLTAKMQAHIRYGLAGAPTRTLDALGKREIIEVVAYTDHKGRASRGLGLTPLGLCVKTLLCGVDPECVGDADMIELRELDGGRCRGPAIWQPCDKHPDQGSVHRWVWEQPEDGDHESAITGSEPQCLASCPGCDDEDTNDDD